MDNVSEKSVVGKGFKNMIVLGLGLTVIVGFTPVTARAGFENPAKQTRQFNGQSQDSHLMRVSAGERVIMARGGNRSGGGGGMGQRGGGDSERGYKYGPGDGTGTRKKPGDGTGYGAKKKGAGTGDCDGTGPKGKGRGNRTN